LRRPEASDVSDVSDVRNAPYSTEMSFRYEGERTEVEVEVEDRVLRHVGGGRGGGTLARSTVTDHCQDREQQISRGIADLLIYK
jgi:hypothetical protein